MDKPLSRRRAASFTMVFSYIGVGLSAVTSILLVPLYLRYFDLAAYGAWVASANIVGLLGIIEGGLGLVLMQRAASASGRDEPGLFEEISGSGAFLGIGLGVLTAFIGAAIAPWVPGWIRADASQYAALSRGVLLASLGSGFLVVYNLLGAIAAAKQRTLFAGVTNISALAAGILVTVWGLWRGWGVTAIGLGTFVRGGVSLLLICGYSAYFWRVESLRRPVVSLAMCRTIFRATLPMTASRTGSIIFANSQAAIVSVILNPSMAAILTISSRVYELDKAVLAPFGSSVFAGLSQVMGQGDREKARNVSNEIFDLFSAVSAICLGVTLALNQSFIDVWVGSDKFGGNALSIMLCLGAVMISRMNLLVTMVTAFGEIARMAWVQIIELFIRIPLMFILVRFFGLIGMPVAEFLSVVLITGWYANLMFFRKLHLHGVGARRALLNGTKPLVSALGIGIIWSLFIPHSRTMTNFIVQTLVCTLAISLSVYAFSPSSRAVVRNAFTGLAGRLRSLAGNRKD